MTDEQYRDNIIRWLSDYCNKTFDPNALPPGIAIAVEKLMKWLQLDLNIKAESLGDHSITYALNENQGNLPPQVKELLVTYRKMKW